MEKYFVMRYDEYRDLVKNDSYGWIAVGHKPGTLTTDDLYHEYKDIIDFMTDEDATEALSTADGLHDKHSLCELCNDLNNHMRKWKYDGKAWKFEG